MNTRLFYFLHFYRRLLSLLFRTQRFIAERTGCTQ